MDCKNKEIINYNYNFLCSYKNEKDYEKSETIYRKEFLKAFNLDEFSEKIISTTTDLLYKKLIEDSYIQNIIIEVLKINPQLKLFEKDNYKPKELAFTILFSYDYFYIFHKLLCYYLDITKVNSVDVVIISKKKNIKKELNSLISQKKV